jgi:hypothetical protein
MAFVKAGNSINTIHSSIIPCQLVNEQEAKKTPMSASISVTRSASSGASSA